MLTCSRELFSAESIKHQHDRSLYDEICQAFQRIQDFTPKIDTTDALQHVAEDIGLNQLIAKRMGVKINLLTHKDSHLSAFVKIPALDKNHPFFFNGYIRKSIGTNDYLKLKKKIEGDLIGKIDLEKGVVSGIYSEIESDIFISPDILSGETMTAEQAACVFLHEVGHLITYYEYLGKSVYVTHVLGDGFLEFFDKEIPRRRDKFLRELQSDMELENVEDYGKFVDDGNGEATRLLFMTTYIQKPVTGLNTSYFHMTTMEALADQYVARLGGAKDLAVALDKIYRHHGDVVYKARHKHILMEVVSVVSMVLLFPFAILTIALIEPGGLYDPISDRIARLRRDLVSGSKHPKLGRDERKRIDEDIKAIDRLLDRMNDNVPAFDRLLLLVKPSFRAAKRESSRLMEIEALANNELYRVHNTLKTLES